MIYGYRPTLCLCQRLVGKNAAYKVYSRAWIAVPRALYSDVGIKDWRTILTQLGYHELMQIAMKENKNSPKFTQTQLMELATFAAERRQSRWVVALLQRFSGYLNQDQISRLKSTELLISMAFRVKDFHTIESKLFPLYLTLVEDQAVEPSAVTPGCCVAAIIENGNLGLAKEVISQLVMGNFLRLYQVVPLLEHYLEALLNKNGQLRFLEFGFKLYKTNNQEISSACARILYQAYKRMGSQEQKNAFLLELGQYLSFHEVKSLKAELAIGELKRQEDALLNLNNSIEQLKQYLTAGTLRPYELLHQILVDLAGSSMDEEGRRKSLTMILKRYIQAFSLVKYHPEIVKMLKLAKAKDIDLLADRFYIRSFAIYCIKTQQFELLLALLKVHLAHAKPNFDAKLVGLAVHCFAVTNRSSGSILKRTLKQMHDRLGNYPWLRSLIASPYVDYLDEGKHVQSFPKTDDSMSQLNEMLREGIQPGFNRLFRTYKAMRIKNLEGEAVRVMEIMKSLNYTIPIKLKLFDLKKDIVEQLMASHPMYKTIMTRAMKLFLFKDSLNYNFKRLKHFQDPSRLALSGDLVEKFYITNQKDMNFQNHIELAQLSASLNKLEFLSQIACKCEEVTRVAIQKNINIRVDGESTELMYLTLLSNYINLGDYSNCMKLYTRILTNVRFFMSTGFISEIRSLRKNHIRLKEIFYKEEYGVTSDTSDNQYQLDDFINEVTSKNQLTRLQLTAALEDFNRYKKFLLSDEEYHIHLKTRLSEEINLSLRQLGELQNLIESWSKS